MTDLPYTDADLRAEAAAQHAVLVDDPDFMGVGEGMQDAYVASTLNGDEGSTWAELLPYEADGGKAYAEAQRKIHALIPGADISEWAVNLGADGLTETTSLIWTCVGSGRDLAVQIAHRPGVKPEIHDEIESAVRLAVERVLDERGLKPRLERI